MNTQKRLRKRIFQVDIQEADQLLDTIKYPFRNGAETRKFMKYKKMVANIEATEKEVVKETQ